MLGRQKCLDLLSAAKPAVLPSLLLCDFTNLRAEIDRLETAGVAALHLDVMDGTFVPNFTYGMTIVEAIRRVTDLPLDVHLMMINPEKYIEQFVEAGADLVTVHAEAVADPAAAMQQIHQAGAAAGIAVNPATPVSKLESALPDADMALVMSVNAGFGGQSFMPEVLTKFSQIRSLPGGEEILLQIDGGINAGTIGEATGAGAELLVVGSGLFKFDDYSNAMETLMSGLQQ